MMDQDKPENSSFNHVLMLCKSIFKNNFCELIVFYFIILFLLVGIAMTHMYLHSVQLGGGLTLSTLLIIPLISILIYCFAWFGLEIEKNLNKPNFKIALKHLLSGANSSMILSSEQYYWLKVYLYAVLLLASIAVMLLLGPFTFFLPYSIFKANFLFLPYFAIMQNEPLSSMGMGYQMRVFFKFNHGITKRLRWKLFWVHFLGINFFWVLYLVNLIKWNLKISINSNFLVLILTLIFAMFLLCSWLIMNVWANVLVKHYDNGQA